MLTAEQIAEQLDVKIAAVRYRLSELRRNNQVKAEQYGTTYVYPPCVVDKVRALVEKE